jgi:hypothetical protein
MTYSEKLKDPRWQRRRLEILSKCDFACENCQTKSEQLHVHHRMYSRGKMPWEYEDWAFNVVCEECHSSLQDQMESAHEVLAKYPGFMAGISRLKDRDLTSVSRLERLVRGVSNYRPDLFAILVESLNRTFDSIRDFRDAASVIEEDGNL